MTRAKTHPKHAPRVPFTLLVTGLIVGGLALLLALNTASAANELRRHDLATRDNRIAAAVEQLGNEVAASAAPGNLQRAAAALGMVPAVNPAFIVMGPNGAVTVLGKPKAAPNAPLVMAPAPTKAKPASSTAKPSTSAKASASASASASKSAATTKSAPASKPKSATSSKSPTSSKSAKPRPKPTPTPTPTPTVTLTGGNR